jgi:twitching motility protein PilT
MTSLAEAADVYFGSADPAGWRIRTHTGPPEYVNAAYWPRLGEMRAAAVAATARSQRPESPSVSMKFDDVVWRVTEMPSPSGESNYELRRVADQIRSLDAAGVPEKWRASLTALGRSTGLTLICGASGARKTTVAGGLIKAFLEEWGGVCHTLEEPPEMPLHGTHGDRAGLCLQNDVTERGYTFMMQRILRSRADYIFIGEITMPDAAAEAIRAGLSGHPVLATLHANWVPGALRRLIALAEASREFSRGTVAGLLADLLRAVFCQRLIGSYLKMEGLIVPDGDVDAAATRSKIRSGAFELLADEIQELGRRNSAG